MTIESIRRIRQRELRGEITGTQIMAAMRVAQGSGYGLDSSLFEAGVATDVIGEITEWTYEQPRSNDPTWTTAQVLADLMVALTLPRKSLTEV